MAKEKYLIIDGETKGELSENITLVELTDEEVTEYMERSWNRDTPPDIIISVAVIEGVLKGKPKTFNELFNEEETS